MLSTFSAESEDSVSASKEPGCKPSPFAKSSRTVKKSSRSVGPASRSTKTSGCSPAPGWQQMELLPTSSAEDSPARTFPSRAKQPASPRERAAAYGSHSPELLASYNRATSSWRTSQLCLDGELTVFSETWPRSGTMRNGIAYRLPPLAPLMRGTGSGSLPTMRSGCGATGRLRSREKVEQSGHRSRLEDYVVMYPTPTVQDASNNGGPSQYQRNSLPLNAVVGGALNPDWIEWLMGFPTGWTALKPSVTPSSRKSRK